MLISYLASTHSAAATVFWRWVLLALLVGSLGACQRASYQFQPIASTTYQASAPLPEPESAVVTVAAPAAVRLGESHRATRRSARYRVRLPRALRVAIPSLPRPCAAGVTASVVAPASARLQRQEPGPVDKPVRHRSRTIAILLAVLSITYLPFSLHNFYLGYYGRGALAIALLVVASSLAVLGLFAGIFSAGGIGFVGVLGIAMFAGWLIWQASDLIRIITGDLQPKDGSYGKK